MKAVNTINNVIFIHVSYSKFASRILKIIGCEEHMLASPIVGSNVSYIFCSIKTPKVYSLLQGYTLTYVLTLQWFVNTISSAKSKIT